MLSPETMWNELVFQARLRYLMFKRCVWAFETLMVALVTMVGFSLPLDLSWRLFFIAIAVARALTEAINHYQLAINFNARDQYLFFPFLTVHLITVFC